MMDSGALHRSDSHKPEISQDAVEQQPLPSMQPQTAAEGLWMASFTRSLLKDQNNRIQELEAELAAQLWMTSLLEAQKKRIQELEAELAAQKASVKKLEAENKRFREREQEDLRELEHSLLSGTTANGNTDKFKASLAALGESVGAAVRQGIRSQVKKQLVHMPANYHD